MPPETVKSLLDGAVRRLAQAGCETPLLDARLLLQNASGLSREDLILDPHRTIGEDERTRFEGWIVRRAGREPVSRILGEREFFGRPFRISPAVLDPRPDTETLIDAALDALPPAARILDLGTGSGAIIVTLLAERLDAEGVAVDLSAKALAVAASNAFAHGVGDRLQLVEGSWFDCVDGRFDLIVSNPPYVPDVEVAELSPDVRGFDPHLALMGGKDGLDAYRAIAAGAGGHLAADGAVLVEIGAGQAHEIERIFAGWGFSCANRAIDLGGHVRCLSFCRV